MSRHYGSPIEPDSEPDTREPDPTLDALVDKFYEDAFWEPDYTELEKQHEPG